MALVPPPPLTLAGHTRDVNPDGPLQPSEDRARHTVGASTGDKKGGGQACLDTFPYKPGGGGRQATMDNAWGSPHGGSWPSNLFTIVPMHSLSYHCEDAM